MRRVWLETTLSYGVTVPTNPEWVRHGLRLRLAVPLGLVALFADTAFTTAPSTSVDGRSLSARIWPVGVGLTLRLSRPRWRIAGGPRLSLQIIDAEASSGAQVGSARRFAAGLGLLGEAVWLFSRYVGGLFTLAAEVLVPNHQFAAGGPSTSDIGWVQFHFDLGLLISIP